MKFQNHRAVYSVLFIVSLSLFLVSVITQGPFTFGYSDHYGIVLKLDWVYWAGYLASVILVFYHFINFEKIDTKYAFLTLTLFVLYLIGTPFLYENLPRFEDTWLHSSFAESIYDTGKVKTPGGVYEGYPGSFIFYGALFNVLPSFYVMKFLPLILYILGIFIVFLAFKNLLGPKAAFLVAVLYMLFNWTVEDNHISPQFLMLNIYFLFMFATIKILKGTENRKEYMYLIGVLSVAIVFSHVFTPIFLILILAFTYILCKGLRKKILPILVILSVVFLIHEVFFATTLKSFIEYVANFDGFTMMWQKFVGAGSASRFVFIASRLSILAVSVVLGVLGILQMRMNNHKTSSRFVLAWAFALVPFLVFSALIMEGEFSERFALVSSLPLAVGAAYFLTNKKSKVLIIAFLLLLSPLYFIGKYGNEAFESQSIQKLNADCFAVFLDSRCYENNVVVDSRLNYYIEDLGKTYFTVTRESILSSNIYGNSSSTSAFDLIESLENERLLNRVYSSNDAWAYVSR